MNDDVLRMLVSFTSLKVSWSGLAPSNAAFRNDGTYGDGFFVVMRSQSRYRARRPRRLPYLKSETRKTGDAFLYTCLFASHGVDLRSPMRAGASDVELLDLLRHAWSQRADRYSELRGELRTREAPLRKVEMNYIGG